MNELDSCLNIISEKSNHKLRVDCCSQYVNTIPKTGRLLKKEHKSQLIDHLRDQNLELCLPDKGDRIVLIDCHDYVIKLSTKLSDSVKFSKETMHKCATEKTEQILTKEDEG